MTAVADHDGQLSVPSPDARNAVASAELASTDAHIELVERYSAHNYHPLPIVVAEAEGAWVTDVEGKRYLDMLAAYSALNFGHRHPDLIAAAHAQLERVTLTSRAFHNDQMGPFCEGLAELCGMEMVLPMNSGAEAIETAVKTARRWGYDVKGVPEDRAKIVTCEGNFHGRTITIVSFSTDPSAKGGFGPFTPGFETVPYGDADGARDLARRPRRRRVPRRADPGRGGGHRAARGLPAPGPRALRRASGAVDRRRDPIGARSDRTHVRLRARGRAARRVRGGQGARRRHRAHLGRRVEARRARGVPPRRARLDVRRQPARMRDRARGAAAARHRRVPAARPTSWAPR